MAKDETQGVETTGAEDGDRLDNLLGDEPRPRAKKRRRPLLWILLTLFVALPLVFIGYYAVWATVALNSIKKDPTLLPAGNVSRPPVAATADYQNIVLMGSDTRDPNVERGRSDALMIAHIPATRDKVYIISFPRDMYVPIPGHGSNKINAAYSFGGAALTVQTLEQLVNLRMDHVVTIDFDGFVGLTTAVGGVTVYNRYPSNQPCEVGVPHTFPVGEITIEGREALCWVRERYDLPNGDLDRAARHRDVVKALALKLMRPEVIANPVTFTEVASQVSQYLTVDPDLTADYVRNLALSLKIKGGSDIVVMQAPISGFASDPVAGAIDVVNTAQLAELATAMATGTMADYCAKYGIR